MDIRYRIGTWVCAAFTAFGIAAGILSMTEGSTFMIGDIVQLVIAALIGYYAVAGYRRPHGNMLKFIMLVYAASYMFTVYICAKQNDIWQMLVAVVSIGMICYVAGRLHRVRQNAILMAIITLGILSVNLVGIIDGVASIGVVTHIVLWIDICAAYFLRYKLHQLAGLMDGEDD